MLVANSDADQVSGEVFNIACGGCVTLNEVASGINGLLGTQFEPNYADPRVGDIKHSQADISKARRCVGFDPVINFLEGLSRTLAWYQQELDEAEILEKV